MPALFKKRLSRSGGGGLRFNEIAGRFPVRAHCPQFAEQGFDRSARTITL